MYGNQPLSVNQTFFQYELAPKYKGFISNKFLDLFLNDESKSFSKYKDSILNDEHKFIISLFSPLFIEKNDLVCFGVNRTSNLVAIPYNSIFYNDKPNLSLYKLIGIYDNEGDMVKESDLYINQIKSDHWVSGTYGRNPIWYSYCHQE